MTCPHCLNDPWLTPPQVSELLGFSEDWVLEKALDGTLPSYEVPSASGLRIHRRFLLSEIEGWRASRKFSVEDEALDEREPSADQSYGGNSRSSSAKVVQLHHARPTCASEETGASE